ncbi:MAG: hypothetical protein J1F06_05365, partial [Prevotellaceae bacterium]|nr:hypothetical protein [Prevotellaceae bacterium]
LPQKRRKQLSESLLQTPVKNARTPAPGPPRRKSRQRPADIAHGRTQPAKAVHNGAEADGLGPLRDFL